MKISKGKILKNYIFLFLIFTILFYPKIIDYSSFTVAKIVVYIVKYIPYTIAPIMIIFLWNYNKMARRFYVCLIIYRLVYFVADIYNGASINDIKIWFENTMLIIATVVILGSAVKANAIRCFSVISTLGNIYILIDVVTQILYPDGLGRIEMYNSFYQAVTWSDSVGFIDVDNRLSLFFIFFLFVNLSLQQILYGKIKNYIPIFLVLLDTYITWSGTGISAIIFICMFLLLKKSKIVNKIIDGYWIILIYIGALLLFVVAQKFNIFRFFIEGILKKDMSLSSRTQIWLFYLNMIKQKPLLGYGTKNAGAWYHNTAGDTWYAHNQMLDILVQGGLLAMFLFCIVIVVVKSNVDRIKDIYIKGLFSVCLLAYFIVGIAEHFLVNKNLCFYGFLCMGFCINDLYISDRAREKKKFRIKRKIVLKRNGRKDCM